MPVSVLILMLVLTLMLMLMLTLMLLLDPVLMAEGGEFTLELEALSDVDLEEEDGYDTDGVPDDKDDDNEVVPGKGEWWRLCDGGTSSWQNNIAAILPEMGGMVATCKDIRTQQGGALPDAERIRNIETSLLEIMDQLKGLRASTVAVARSGMGKSSTLNYILQASEPNHAAYKAAVQEDGFKPEMEVVASEMHDPFVKTISSPVELIRDAPVGALVEEYCVEDNAWYEARVIAIDAAGKRKLRSVDEHDVELREARHRYKYDVRFEEGVNNGDVMDTTCVACYMTKGVRLQVVLYYESVEAVGKAARDLTLAITAADKELQAAETALRKAALREIVKKKGGQRKKRQRVEEEAAVDKNYDAGGDDDDGDDDHRNGNGEQRSMLDARELDTAKAMFGLDPKQPLNEIDVAKLKLPAVYKDRLGHKLVYTPSSGNWSQAMQQVRDFIAWHTTKSCNPWWRLIKLVVIKGPWEVVGGGMDLVDAPGAGHQDYARTRSLDRAVREASGTLLLVDNRKIDGDVKVACRESGCLQQLALAALARVVRTSQDVASSPLVKSKQKALPNSATLTRAERHALALVMLGDKCFPYSQKGLNCTALLNGRPTQERERLMKKEADVFAGHKSTLKACVAEMLIRQHGVAHVAAERAAAATVEEQVRTIALYPRLFFDSMHKEQLSVESSRLPELKSFLQEAVTLGAARLKDEACRLLRSASAIVAQFAALQEELFNLRVALSSSGGGGGNMQELARQRLRKAAPQAIKAWDSFPLERWKEKFKQVVQQEMNKVFEVGRKLCTVEEFGWQLSGVTEDGQERVTPAWKSRPSSWNKAMITPVWPDIQSLLRDGEVNGYKLWNVMANPLFDGTGWEFPASLCFGWLDNPELVQVDDDLSPLYVLYVAIHKASVAPSEGLLKDNSKLARRCQTIMSSQSRHLLEDAKRLIQKLFSVREAGVWDKYESANVDAAARFCAELLETLKRGRQSYQRNLVTAETKLPKLLDACEAAFHVALQIDKVAREADALVRAHHAALRDFNFAARGIDAMMQNGQLHARMRGHQAAICLRDHMNLLMKGKDANTTFTPSFDWTFQNWGELVRITTIFEHVHADLLAVGELFKPNTKVLLRKIVAGLNRVGEPPNMRLVDEAEVQQQLAFLQSVFSASEDNDQNNNQKWRPAFLHKALLFFNIASNAYAANRPTQQQSLPAFWTPEQVSTLLTMVKNVCGPVATFQDAAQPEATNIIFQRFAQSKFRTRLRRKKAEEEEEEEEEQGDNEAVYSLQAVEKLLTQLDAMFGGDTQGFRDAIKFYKYPMPEGWTLLGM
eukprot:jgi/Chlat1/1245/Chrsp115S01690